MITAIVKENWKPLAALLLVAVGVLMILWSGYSIADRSWEARWQARDLADLQAKQVFTEQQRRIELQRQGVIDDIQAQAENDIAKAQRNAAIADAESKRLQDGIADAIARLQADIGNPGASISSKTRASTSSLLAVLFREIDAAAGDYAAEADRARKAGLRCEAAYDAVRSSNDLTK